MKHTPSIVDEIDKLRATNTELLEALSAASRALKSYQYGNASSDLAKEIATHADEAIAKAKE